MEQELGEKCDPFFADIVEQSGVLRVTIPKRTIEFMGWKEGDTVRVVMHKVLKKEE